MALGKLYISENTAATPSAAKIYNKILVINEFGSFETLMITETELKTIRRRERKNTEDEIKPTLLDKIKRLC